MSVCDEEMMTWITTEGYNKKTGYDGNMQRRRGVSTTLTVKRTNYSLNSTDRNKKK
ncbi:hypothetical protein PISMIDRAFT_673533 [Pisolithus microcarpus 441]|uniref:Uncharacterized protein n=1 Tax=Pisolithus microcarpus 441 TaxID=765257 RepID=A0A0C9ZR47_9AGAM|nr:hypothetical protein PISMIDRAFT_673533 [Pisolithus microcarpus 441]